MSQIIPCHSGCLDLDEDFGDWKEYSAFCLFLLPEKPDTVIRHKQCPNAGKSTKENMGGRKGAWGCWSLTYWDSYASAFIVCQSPASPHSLRSTGARERPRWFSCDSGGQERLYQHKVHLFQQAQGMESLRFVSFEDSRDYSSEWISSSTSSAFKGFAVAWGCLPVIRCDPTKCFTVLGKIDLHLNRLSTSVLLPSRNPTTGVLGIKAVNKQ